MYEGVVRLLIVFLTHPGVLIPIPATGMFAWIRGLLQASVSLFLHSFSDGKNSQLVSFVYWGILLIKSYILIAISLGDART